MIRDRFALAVMGVTVGFLTTLAGVANLDAVPRSVDIVALWLAGGLQLVLVIAWALIPRLPRWIVAGWGLILVATGIGVIITAPIPAGATAVPWALCGLLLAGIVTMVLSAIHGGESGPSLA